MHYATDMVERCLRALYSALPLLFAFGFLVPVIAAGLEAMGIDAPLGLSPIALALIVGGGWGLVAQIRGRWV